MPIDTPDWVRDAVFYQIFPDRFASSPRVRKPGPLEPWDEPPTLHGFKGGDLLGIAERLPYLADLGVTALYLTPIFASASNHRYHTYDYLRVDPLLGGDEALRELLDTAHGMGMRVVLDGVFNHTGRGFWAFHHVLETGAASPYRHWFHFDQAALDAGRQIRAYPEGYARAGVATDEPEAGAPELPGTVEESFRRLGYRAWWGLPALPKLNTDDPGARAHLLDVAEHWLRFGIDGWRLDVPEEVEPGFWREFRARCRAVRADAYLVGEIWHEAHDWLQGDRFDAVMHYPLAKAILAFAAGSRLQRDLVAFHHEYALLRTLDGPAFAAELERIMGLYDPAVTSVQLNLVGSHDTPRFRTLAGGDRDAIRLAVLLQATLPGAPSIYYGDEIGLEGGADPDCRRSFPVHGAAHDEELHAWFRRLLRGRAAHRALRRGTIALAGAEAGAVAYVRVDVDERLLVAVNAGDHEVRLPLHLPEAASASWTETDLTADGEPRRGSFDPSGRSSIAVPARAGLVVRLGG